MVAQTQTGSSARPPPDVPNDPKLSTQTSQYLRNFALWCRHGFQDSLRNQEALQGIMLRGFDTQGGNPNVYMLEVDNAGIAYLAPMALGSGAMGTPVPIGDGEFLPLSGGIVTGDLYVEGGVIASSDLEVGGTLTSNGAFDATGSSNVFYQAPNIISQAGGGPLMVQATAGYQPIITFHDPGAFACNFGMDAGGNFYSGGWSFGTTAYKFWTSRDFANPCDYRIKEDVRPLDSTWEVVKQLKPVSYTHKDYDWVKADGLERWGFVAHELQETLVESAATGVKDSPDLVQSPNMLVVIAALTKTVQELQARVEALEGAR